MRGNQLHDTKKLRPNDGLYIALDDYDLSFSEEELELTKILWNKGESFMAIADKVRHYERGQIEIFTLLMDLLQKGRLKPREGGIWGESM